MKIAAALAAVKVSRGWSRHLKETSSPDFQAAAEDRSRKCKLAANGRESQPPWQTRDTRGCNGVDCSWMVRECSWMMRVPERRSVYPRQLRGHSAPVTAARRQVHPRANKRDERRGLRPSHLSVRSQRAPPPPRHRARVWPGRGEEGRGHGGRDG